MVAERVIYDQGQTPNILLQEVSGDSITNEDYSAFTKGNIRDSRNRVTSVIRPVANFRRQLKYAHTPSKPAAELSCSNEGYYSYFAEVRISYL